MKNILFSGYSNTYEKIGLVFFIAILAWVLFDSFDTSPILKEEKVKGVVINIKEPENKNAKDPVPYVTIEAPDKTLINMNFFRKPSPKIGDSIPLTKNIYENKIKYSFDKSAWKEQNSGY